MFKKIYKQKLEKTEQKLRLFSGQSAVSSEQFFINFTFSIVLH